MTGDEAPTDESASRARYGTGLVVVAMVAVAIGVIVRLLLLPAEGHRGDLDQFVLWVHGIAVKGLPNAYDQNLSFPPVMAYIWGVLAAIQPAFQSVTDSADPAIRAMMKTPATLADLGLAALVWYLLRDRPIWAVVGAIAVLLHPVVVDVSAWWGQYESIYLLSALAAVVLAVKGHNEGAAALLAVSLMTKPQAVPFLVPFAAWFWATGGLRGFIRATIVGVAVVVLLWLPFVDANGPTNYVRNLADYQGEIFNILSLRAWNVWWLVQSFFAGGGFVADDVPFLGPVTLRSVGYAVTGVLELVIAIGILRDPRPRSLILGLAASTLVAFAFLTSMHERYAYGAIVFLILLIPEARARWLAVALGVVYSLNVLTAGPPIRRCSTAALPVAGWASPARSRCSRSRWRV